MLRLFVILAVACLSCTVIADDINADAQAPIETIEEREARKKREAIAKKAKLREANKEAERKLKEYKKKEEERRTEFDKEMRREEKKQKKMQMREDRKKRYRKAHEDKAEQTGKKVVRKKKRPKNFAKAWAFRTHEICKNVTDEHVLSSDIPGDFCKKMSNGVREEFSKWAREGVQGMMQNMMKGLRGSGFGFTDQIADHASGPAAPGPGNAKMLSTAEVDPFFSAGMIVMDGLVHKVLENFFSEDYKKENPAGKLTDNIKGVIKNQGMAWLLNVEQNNKEVMEKIIDPPTDPEEQTMDQIVHPTF